MMNKICIGWWALALVCAICACSEEDDGAVTGQALEITFSGSRVGEEWVDSARTVTRATDATWTDGDAIGIYMLPVGATGLANATQSNHKYVYSLSTTTFSRASLDQTLCYSLNDNDKVNFAAYYPYSSLAANANTVTFNFAGQGTKVLKESVDFCYHRSTASYSKNSPMTSMPFQHKFSKIRMTVKQGTSAIDLTTLSAVKLKGMPASATVNLNTLMSATDDTAVLSAFTISGETDITAYIQSKNATEAVVEAIIAPHTIPIGKTIDFTIGGETKTYTFDTALTLDPGKVYDFVFTLKASGQQVPPSDSEDGMTNSYIVIPGKLLTFEVKRAYNSSNRVFAETLRAGNVDTYPHTFTTEVLWDDNGVISGTPTVSGTGHIAEVTVQTTNNHGNAVVAIKVGSDIVWSYHIWVTDYDPQVAANTFTANSGYVFMNRNLGARERDLTYGVNTFGLLYQWGRKDPFPGSMQGAAGWPASGGIDSKFVGLGTRTTVGDATNAAAIVTSIKNPQTFYSYKNTDYYNWLPTKDNTLWNTAGTNQKTVYDPCPSGWRVPRFLDNTYDEAHSPWKDYASPSGTDTWGKWDKGTPTGGMKFGPDTNPNSDDAQYPAPGYLHYANGAAARGYETGLYWASNQYKETSFYAAALYLRYTGQVDVHYYGGYRAHGFSVRCVRE